MPLLKTRKATSLSWMTETDNKRMLRKNSAALQFSANAGVRHHMEFVAFNYFPPNNVECIEGVIKALSTSEIELTHLGINDPPKKWKGNLAEILDVLNQGKDMTNYTFAKDIINKVELDFALGNFPEAITSTISISGKNKDLIERVCLHFSKHVKSYLCISGQLGLGAQQSWSYLMQSIDCPTSILEQVKNA